MNKKETFYKTTSNALVAYRDKTDQNFDIKILFWPKEKKFHYDEYV